MSKEKKLIPELRFPEFVDDGEWEIKSVENNIELLSGIALKSSELSNDASGTPILRGINITEGEIRHSVEMDKYYLGDTSEIEKYLVREHDIVIGMDGSKVGKNVALISEQDAFSILIQRVARIRAKDSDVKFLYQYFLSQKFRNYVDTVNTSSGIPHISAKQIKDYEIGFPPKTQEQQKIAACLFSLDNLIEAHNQKLEALKEHKKGLMQNLFPQEGEKVPKFRFPEFDNDGEWVVKTLDKVATFSKGKGISKSDIVENGSLPCIRYGELYTHYNETISEIKSYTNINSIELVLSQANDVIIPASGETQIDIATASCVLESGIALGGDLNIIRANINGVFLSYYLNNAKKMEIARMAQGISVVHLYPNQLKTLSVSIPKPEEQIKIAETLASLDELISINTQKIEQLKIHKKGLMQSLFPNNES